VNGQVNPSVAEARRAGRGGPHSRPGGAGPAPADVLSLQHRHPLERWLARRSFRWLLGRLSAPCAEGTPLEGILASYGRSDLPLSLRIRHWPFHKFIDRMRGQVTRETFQRRLAGYAPALRGLVIAARSVARFGLTCPQRFVAPLFAVWNITNRCNLRCRHCYQNSDAHPPTGELSARQRLAVVDKLGSAYVPMLAVAGGEPTACPDLLEVLRRAANHKMHTSIATNGTTMTERLAADLAAAQVRYVEVSLDSVDPARHDAFRGVPGMWERAVRGARIVARTPGLRLGIAMCVHRGNLAEVADMIEFAISLGAGCFAHFNFIPVGRGLKMVSGEITPQQREQLLETLNRYMQSGRIGVISTAPQLGRTCLMRAGEAGRTACSHAGSGSGFKARVVAKYLGGCGAGRTYICIQPNGDATPCVYLPHRVIGNLLAAGVEEVFRNGYYDLLNDRTSRLHHCRVCDFANYCGGCRARSDAYFGRLDAGDPGCIFNQEQWDQLVASGVINPQDADAPPEKMNITPTLHGPA
jgi:radical SAM protein with 4Fe4S-binding SPASM domain